MSVPFAVNDANIRLIKVGTGSAGRCSESAIALIPRHAFGEFGVGELAVADHSEVVYTTADGNDYPAHEAMYENFIKLVKYGTITVVIIVALMGYFLG